MYDVFSAHCNCALWQCGTLLSALYSSLFPTYWVRFGSVGESLPDSDSIAPHIWLAVKLGIVYALWGIPLQWPSACRLRLQGLIRACLKIRYLLTFPSSCIIRMGNYSHLNTAVLLMQVMKAMVKSDWGEISHDRQAYSCIWNWACYHSMAHLRGDYHH